MQNIKSTIIITIMSCYKCDDHLPRDCDDHYHIQIVHSENQNVIVHKTLIGNNLLKTEWCQVNNKDSIDVYRSVSGKESSPTSAMGRSSTQCHLPNV